MEERLIKLREMVEVELSREILIPLFGAIHKTEVDFHHGPSEKGKDIICWKEDDYGDLELTVIQVKRLSPNGAAAGKNTFIEVCNQLYQAKQAEVPYRDGLKYLPHKVIFITPFQIDARSLESNFESFREFNKLGAKVIDGVKILELIDSKCPRLNEKLISPEKIIKEDVLKEIQQDKLIGALTNDDNIAIEKLYVDLDFCFGEHLPSMLFHGKERFKIEIDAISQRFNLLTLFYKISKELFSINPFEEEFEIISKNNAKYKEIFDTDNNRKDELLKHIHEITKEIESVDQDLILKNNNLSDYYKSKNIDDSCSEKIKFYTGAISKWKDKDASHSDIIIEREFRKALNQDGYLGDLLTDIDILLCQKKDLEKKLLGAKNEQFELNKKQYTQTVRVDLREVRKIILQKEQRLLSKLNDPNIITQDIREVLNEIVALRNNVKKISSCKIIKEEFYSESAVDSYENKSISLPLKRIFDSKVNFLLVGEAGAGKTTTLGNYYKSSVGDKPVMLLSLAKLFANDVFDSSSHIDCFINLIIKYFHHPKVDYSYIQEMFVSEGLVLILDGYDEVIAKVPELKNLISELIKVYPTLQIIVSSRPTDSNRLELPLIKVSLLPFTEYQRTYFINKWFEEKEEDLSKNITLHLDNNKKLSQVVRFPFLIATLCSLAAKDVPLPKSESKLYEKRLELLLGRYDVYKQIKRNYIEHNELLLVARKVAFYLHSNHIRSDFKKTIYSNLLNNSILTMTHKNVKKALDELLDPCNVLITMDDIGRVGFGHLRHQEYLVALEFSMNKDIDIVSYLSDYWWEGALFLFSQFADSLKFIINQIIVNGLPLSNYKILEKMIKERPKKERTFLQVELERTKINDIRDDIIFSSEY